MKTPKTIINIKPFGKFNRWAGLLGGITAAFCCSVANAQYSNAVVGATLIYSNGFDGLSTVNITNTPADKEINIYGGPGTTTNWVDLSGSSDTNAFYANGTVGTMQASSIVLPFTPQSNHVYALQASVTLAAGPGTWIAAGYDFYSKIQGSSHNLFNGNGGWNWALINYSGNVEYFLGQSGANGIYNATAFTAAANLTHVLTLILDTTSNENPSNRWIASGYVDAVPMGTKIFPSNPSIAGLGYGQNGTMSAPQNIKWNYFTLTANQELIIQQPISGNVDQGSAFTNSVLAGGTPPFFYQWCTNGVAIGGATNATLVLNPVLPGDASSNYTVVVTNTAYGAVTSSPAALSVNTVPAFSTADPITYTNAMTLFGGTNIDGTNYLGSSPLFSVFASGKRPMFYYWSTNGMAVGGATNASFAFSNCQWDGPTNFTCIASNSLGTATNTWAVQYIPAPTAPYPQGVLALGPVGYWRLDETNDDPYLVDDGEICNDFMSGNNGIYTNTALAQTPGYSVTTDPNETAAQFGPPGATTGAEAYGIGTNDDFSASSNAEFTVSVWANGGYEGFNTGTEPQNGGLVAKGGDGNEEFALDDGGTGAAARFMVRNGAGTASMASSTFQLGGNDTWNHLVGVCDESNGLVSLYINGLLAAQVSIPRGSGVLPDALIPITIGADGAGQFYGGLDDVAIFNYALNAGQVAQLYEDGGNSIVASIVAPLPPTNWVYQTGGTLTISAAAFGTPPIGYYWTNLTTGAVMGSGSTNLLNILNATLTIPNAPASLSGDRLELVVTNASGSTNWFTTLFSPPRPVTLGYTNAILYTNDFDGGTWTIAGMSLTAENSLIGGTNTTWIDVLGTNDTGSMEANGIDNCTLGNSWIVPFTPRSGYIYTETASLAFSGNPGNWVGVGFAQNLLSNTTTARFDDDGPDGVNWIILSENTGNVQYFAGPGGIPVQGLTNENNFFTSGAGTHTVQVVLDTTQPQWVQYAWVDGVSAGTNTYTTNPTIAAAGITQNGMGSPNNLQWNYWSLSQVAPGGVPPYLLAPLPSSILLTNTTVAISATAYGSAPLGYSWSFNNSTVLASGITNNLSPLSADLSVPTSSLGSGQLELTVTNAYGTNITLVTLVSTVNPNPTNIVATVTNNDLYLTWPVDHTGWQLQAQTNSVGVGLSTNWVNYNPSTGTNQVAVPINVTNGVVFYRLIYNP